MKTLKDIRNLLCEEIDNLRAKTTTPANVNAIVNATGKILSTVKMEMEYARLIGKQPHMSCIDIEELPEPPKLTPTPLPVPTTMGAMRG